MRARPSLALATLLLMAAAPTLPPGQSQPVRHPYDETADAHAQVAAAFAAAQHNGHNILLDFGGNWCPDCRMLAGVMAEPTVQPWLAANFNVVMIDVGRYTKNTDIAARWGIPLHAAPSVLVVTPTGKLINGDDVTGLANARAFSRQAVVDLLDKMAHA